MVLWVAASATAFAQQAAADPGPCDAVLAEAERLYVEQRYEVAELSALQCNLLPSARSPDLQRANRLLALTYLKRGMLSEARVAVVKILGADSGYQPDPLVDLPVYVALVDAVREQLQVASPAGPPPPAAPPVGDRAERAATSVAARVNVNTASADELDTVPGIGPALAGRIIAYREQNGPFRSVDDLQNVRGIGPRSVERMAPAVTVSTVMVSGGGVARGAAPEITRPTVEPTRQVNANARRINLNAATQEELESLPGIGPALAGRIIAFRGENGPFRSPEEVMRVRGIGPGTFEAIAELITVSGAPSAD